MYANPEFSFGCFNSLQNAFIVTLIPTIEMLNIDSEF